MIHFRHDQGHLVAQARNFSQPHVMNLISAQTGRGLAG